MLCAPLSHNDVEGSLPHLLQGMAKHYQLIIIWGWKLHLGPYSSLKSQNMREFDPHYIWVHPLRIEWLPQFTSFGQPLVSFRVLQINFHLTPYSSSRTCPFMMASWAICYSFKKFHSWLLSRRGWSKGLKSPSLLAWVGRDNRTYGGAAFRTGGYVWFRPHRISQFHIWMPLPFIMPFRHPIGTI